MKQTFFEPPRVEILEVEVEQGFATSPLFDLDNLTDGGTI